MAKLSLIFSIDQSNDGHSEKNEEDENFEMSFSQGDVRNNQITHVKLTPGRFDQRSSSSLSSIPNDNMPRPPVSTELYPLASSSQLLAADQIHSPEVAEIDSENGDRYDPRWAEYSPNLLRLIQEWRNKKGYKKPKFVTTSPPKILYLTTNHLPAYWVRIKDGKGTTEALQMRSVEWPEYNPNSAGLYRVMIATGEQSGDIILGKRSKGDHNNVDHQISYYSVFIGVSGDSEGFEAYHTVMKCWDPAGVSSKLAEKSRQGVKGSFVVKREANSTPVVQRASTRIAKRNAEYHNPLPAPRHPSVTKPKHCATRGPTSSSFKIKIPRVSLCI
jgi:hypothetical protein